MKTRPHRPSPFSSSSWSGLQRLLLVIITSLTCFLKEEAGAQSQFSGSGEEWAQPVYDSLMNSYIYVRDDFVLSYNPTSKNMSYARDQLSLAQLSFLSTPALLPNNSFSGTGQLYSIPLMATAMAIAYNESMFDGRPDLVLSQETLVAMWNGDIVTWNDPRLLANNSWLANSSVAHMNVSLVFCNDSFGEGDVLYWYLWQASDALANKLQAGGFNALPAVAQGRAVSSCTLEEKLKSAQAFGGAALLMVMRPSLPQPGLAMASMVIDSEGSKALPNNANVAQALALASLSQSNLLVNNGTGTAWPLSTMVYLVVQTSSQINNCLMLQNLFSFASWVELNSGSAAILANYNYTNLDAYHLREMLNMMSKVTCNNELVATTSYLIGSGALLPIYPVLAEAYSSSGFQLKYIAASSSLTAITDMISNSYDFGTTGATLTPQEQEDLPDAVLVPMMAYGFVFSYNLPEMQGRQPLVLDWHTIAHIFLGNITFWDDPNITALNPSLKNVLQHLPIGVVYITTSQVITLFMNQVLSLEVPEFNDIVGNKSLVVYPVAQRYPNNTYPISSQNDIQPTLNNQPYSFASLVTFEAETQPKIQSASLKLSSGSIVSPTSEAISTAITNYPDHTAMSIFLSPGNNSWPIVAYNSLIVRTRSMTDCAKAQALAEWIYWTQTSTEAHNIFVANQIVSAGSSTLLLREILNTVGNITCYGRAVSPLAGCITNGTICNDRGTCYNRRCLCNSTWTGTYCQNLIQSSSTVSVLVPILATILPVAFIILLLLVATLAVLLLLSRIRWRPQNDEWTIGIEELEIGELLGTGGFGSVYKAKWKGTEVAVKMLDGREVNSDLRASFVEEARLMSRLRHPNIVLFMAACTKPPSLSIIMEYMVLGSLYELLQNDLIVELPFVLKVKMMHQAARGMHFLHSSGIVHRDLKSLNLLLDNKWNIKVADFGLTRFKDSLAKKTKMEMVGSVPWMAPEVLAENTDIDYFLADVYSFGVIMWEVLTREELYPDLTPPQIAISVITRDLRPPLDAEDCQSPEERKFCGLIARCWQQDTQMRPGFSQITEELVNIKSNHDSSVSRSGSGSSSSISWSNTNKNSSLTDLKTTSSNQLSEPSSTKQIVQRRRLPQENVSYAICDLMAFNEVWNSDPSHAARAIEGYSNLIKSLAKKNEGCIFSTSALNSGGTFMVAFHEPCQAASFAQTLQRKAAEMEMIGPHSRMSLHHVPGPARMSSSQQHSAYEPKTYEEACRLNVVCPAGAILCSAAFAGQCKDLQGLFFIESEQDDGSTFLLDEDTDERPSLDDVSEHCKTLCSSNMCPWIIDDMKLTTTRLLGEGSHGRVDEGTYKHTQVAVKRLYRARMSDEEMITMRREAAILSSLEHPNIVKMMGLCIAGSNLQLVMELVPRGSLRSLLSNFSHKLNWKRKVGMLRDAALGIEFLHSRGIIHRDIKSSNLLVDENWSVKIADFGFATARKDNGTMTRCGTPCWTAPEILVANKGKEVTNKADVYSFGIVMWEVLTRKVPYEHINMVNLIEKVLSGIRPTIPEDTAPRFAEALQACCHQKAKKRPSMADLVMLFNAELDIQDA